MLRREGHALLRDMGEASLERLARVSAAAWREAVRRGERAGRMVVLDEAQRVLARAACAWAGVPLPARDAARRARDLVATLDASGGVGRRWWRATLARGRAERWIERWVRAVRSGAAAASGERALGLVAGLRGPDGALLPARAAAIELLDQLRPTVAVSWSVASAALALARSPEARARLAAEGVGGEYADRFVEEVRRRSPLPRHRCPGAWIARLEVTLALHVLTRCTTWTPAPGQELGRDLGRRSSRPGSGLVLQHVRATAALDAPMPIAPSPAADRGGGAAPVHL
jgi:cytochrome P450